MAVGYWNTKFRASFVKSKFTKRINTFLLEVLLFNILSTRDGFNDFALDVILPQLTPILFFDGSIVLITVVEFFT